MVKSVKPQCVLVYQSSHSVCSSISQATVCARLRGLARLLGRHQGLHLGHDLLVNEPLYCAAIQQLSDKEVTVPLVNLMPIRCPVGRAPTEQLPNV